MKRIFKEPLLHFLLLGGTLFLLFSIIAPNDDAGSNQGEEIVVTSGRIDSLSEQFQKVWQRPPTEQELDGLIREHVREEIMYREALALGLDRDDTIIRRRLKQKLEFISEDLLSPPEPTDEELQEYLESSPDYFRLDARFTFSQIYLNPDKHGDALPSELENLLGRLRELENNSEIAEFGDPLMLEQHYQDVSENEIKRLFGSVFATQLSEQTTDDTGDWIGPIDSGYGVHLVFIREHLEGRLPSLEEVRDSVQREWVSARGNEANEQFYERLLDQYLVTIEMPESADEVGQK